MSAEQPSSEYGSSPSISAELFFCGNRFQIESLGREQVALRAPRALGPGRGEIRLVVGSQLTLIQIDLAEGIDPGRHDQPFVLIKTIEQAVA